MKILITGGHHSSALPVIAEIRSQKPKVRFVWVGHKHSLIGDKNVTLEYREITALEIPFHELKTPKFYKRANPLSIFQLIGAIGQAHTLLGKEKPDVILSFGGYLAVPVVIAAWLRHLPIATHEQTVVIGWANKVISKFATKILVSWKESLKYFPPHKTTYTGLPLRRAIFETRSQKFDPQNDLPTIYITGGKTGSHIINSTVSEALDRLLKKYNVIHQCGDYSVTKDNKMLQDRYMQAGSVPGRYFLNKFIFEDDIGEVFSRADIVISRGGAHTIAELAALNKPAIVIPIPWVSHNEQQKNAEMLRDLGLAEILQEKDLSAESLLNLLEKMFEDLAKYTAKTSTFLGNETKAIADEVLALL
jgi:UDP-N-acetylglucosamine--N-acetylmuramyl-(pentapeptide) pyrophosphoryl-undecaprenol N-acetylglucosamine transferase